MAIEDLIRIAQALERIANSLVLDDIERLVEGVELLGSLLDEMTPPDKTRPLLHGGAKSTRQAVPVDAAAAEKAWGSR